MNWDDIIGKLGIPIAIIIAMGYGIVQMARWLAPRFDRIIDRHLQLLDKLEKGAEKQTESLSTMTSILVQSETRVDEVESALKSGARVIEDNTAATREATKMMAKWGSDGNKLCRLPEALAGMTVSQIELVVAKVKEVKESGS